jgi:ankyrin repeat protein
MLLAKNAKTNIRSKNHRLALHEGAAYGSLDVFKKLEAKTFVDQTGVVHLASLNSDLSVLQYLLSKKPSPSMDTPFPHPPYGTVLHFAARGASESALKSLLALTWNLSPFDKEGKTPLHVAVRSKHYAAARLLMEAGANPNEKDTFGVSVLDEIQAIGDQRMKDIAARRGHISGTSGFGLI